MRFTKEFDERNYPLTIEETVRTRPSVYIDKQLLLNEGPAVAIVYGELLARYRYFANRDQLTEDGWFFNITEDLKDGIGYGATTQWYSIKRLEELGLVQSKLRGLPAKRYFKMLDISGNLPEVIKKERRTRKLKYGDHRVLNSKSQGVESSSTNNNKYNNNKNKNNINYTPSATPQEPVSTPPIFLEKNIPSTLNIGEAKESLESIEPKGKTDFTCQTGADRSTLEGDTNLEDFIIEEADVDPIKKELPKNITPKYLYQLFKDEYVKKYKRYPNNVSPKDIPKVFGILNSTLLKKYGPGRAVEIIGYLFKYYEQLDIDRSRFPRPELSSLTQDWLINKLLDFAYNRVEEEKIEAEMAEKAIDPIIRGPYVGYTKFPGQWNPAFFRFGEGLAFLARHGYLPPGWFDNFLKDPNSCLPALKEGLTSWNKANPDYELDLLKRGSVNGRLLV